MDNRARMNPHQLAEDVVTLAGEYQTMSEELVDTLKFKAQKWAILRAEEGCTSDTQAERKWASTPSGLREMQLKILLKAYEKKMSAIKAMLRVLETEARNQF